MKIFVTGATGFLGYHFVNVAVSQGHEVLCLKRPTSVSLFEPIVEEKIKWVNTDEQLYNVISLFAPEILFHSAWGGVRGNGRNDYETQKDNFIMSKHLFRLYAYKQIISIGSQAEYGIYTGPISENHPLNPENEYAKAKIATCNELQRIAEVNDIEWQWIRIFTLFGEKQKAGLISVAASQFLDGVKEFPTTEGKQIYNYMYSFDFAKAICKILGSKGTSGIYNLAQSFVDDYSNKQILEKIKGITNSNTKIKYGEIAYVANQVMMMTANISKYESVFGAIPRTDFNKALINTIDAI